MKPMTPQEIASDHFNMGYDHVVKLITLGWEERDKLLATLTAKDNIIAGLTRYVANKDAAYLRALAREVSADGRTAQVLEQLSDARRSFAIQAGQAETAESRVKVLEEAINYALVYRGSRDPDGAFLAMACNCLSNALTPSDQVERA